MQDSTSHVSPGFPSADLPQFEATAAQATVAFRDFAEKGIGQAKANYAKMKSAAEEATSILETTYANATKGVADYSLKVVEIGRANSNAAFDYAAELLGARTLAQLVEISTSHARKQIEQFAEQAKELSSLAQRVATSTAEPIKDGFTNLAKKAA
jgi:phasin